MFWYLDYLAVGLLVHFFRAISQEILPVEHGGTLNSKEMGSLRVKQFLLHLCFSCHYVIKQINLGDWLKISQQVPLSCASLSKIFNLSARVLFFDNPIF
jgi:hypothetical protein